MGWGVWAKIKNTPNDPRATDPSRSRRPGTQRSVPTGRSSSTPSSTPRCPRLPPHLTLKQAKALSSGLLKGDPDRGAIVRAIYRDVLAGWTA